MNTKLLIALGLSVLILIGSIIYSDMREKALLDDDFDIESDIDLIDEAVEPETQTVDVYFLEVIDGEEEIVSVKREIDATVSVGKAAINELLKGPSEEEKLMMGFSTSIPEETQLLDIDIQNGVATVDFCQNLEDGVAGSAWVLSIRNQIEKTLMQFESVDSVVIKVEGESEDILQP